jgi:hypothetical protein
LVLRPSDPSIWTRRWRCRSILVTRIPAEYLDCTLVSAAPQGYFNDLRANLSTHSAIKAYREGKLAFPKIFVEALKHFRPAPQRASRLRGS